MTSPNEDTPDLVEIGKIGRAHGIKGEVRLFAEDLDSEIYESGATVWIDSADGPRPMTVEGCRPTPKFGILKLEEISDRTAAERLTNLKVWVAQEDLPSLGEDEFYQVALRGCDVHLLEGGDSEASRIVGEVGGFFATGANDVMVVLTEDGDEVFVPMIEAAIEALEPDKGRVILRPLDEWAAEGTEF